MTRAAVAGPWLLYDGGCPFCSAYVSRLRLRDDAPPVRLVDARDGGPYISADDAHLYNIGAYQSFTI